MHRKHHDGHNDNPSRNDEIKCCWWRKTRREKAIEMQKSARASGWARSTNYFGVDETTTLTAASKTLHHFQTTSTNGIAKEAAVLFMADTQPITGDASTPTAPDRTKKKKACAECRQQKVRHEVFMPELGLTGNRCDATPCQAAQSLAPAVVA